MKRLPGILLFCVGVVFLVILQRNFRQAEASTSWPRVDGRVVVSEEVAGTGRKARRSSKKSAHVEYTYRLAETEYRGNQVTVGNFRQGSGAQQWLRRYPVGTSVSVYYNPADPSEAVLEPGVPGGGRWFYLAPVGLCIAGVWRFFVPGRRQA